MQWSFMDRGAPDRTLEVKIKQHQKWRKSFPYYKVQYWNAFDSTWREIQKSFLTIEKARQFADGLHKKLRFVKVERNIRMML